MLDVINKDNMKRSDEFTSINIKSSKELMYDAGYNIFKSYDFHGKILVLAGSGNNGGDAFVIAKLLFDDGFDVSVYKKNDKFTEDSKYYFDKLNKKIKIINDFNKIDFNKYDIFVDGLFGIGFKGDLKDEEAMIAKSLNSLNKEVISIDINSGLDSDNGLTNLAIKSTVTFAIDYIKPGHLLNMAKDYIGKLKLVKCGIKAIDKVYHLIEEDDIIPFMKKRKNFSNKGDYGYVALIGGSKNYSGAIRLAGLANIALRSGAGVATICVPKNISEIVSQNILEATILNLSSNEDGLEFNKEELDKIMSRYKSITVGMGLGQNISISKIIEYLLNNYDKTLIIDADGLNALSKMDLDILNKTKAEVVLTPHVKEASRLSKIEVDDILNNPVEFAKSFTKKYKSILILKGPTTIISKDEEIFFVDKGSSGMATAGSGDVLCGVLAGVSGFVPEPLNVAIVGVYINGFSGEKAEEENGTISMVAQDTIFKIRSTVKYLEKKSSN
ncbi:MAG: NAD(P)H-hydrate dehydratase [Acholeplasmatales bacterium]|nr:NAD(P)H-hydrate dehydratase [Acholeplasmatales bacterium]